MKARTVLLRLAVVCLGVPFSTAVAWALLVPTFLGVREATRDALVATAGVAGLGLTLVTGLLAMRYAPVLRRAVGASAGTRSFSARDRDLLYAAPRDSAVILMLAAVGVCVLGCLPAAGAVLGDVRTAAVSAAAAALVMASLVLYPAVRRALRPLVETLVPATEDPGPVRIAPADGISPRVALAVGVPSGVTALLVALVVEAHIAATTQAQEEVTAQVFSLALGVPRVPGEAGGQSVAARVLAAGGVRISPGVQYPQAEIRVPEVTPAAASGPWGVPMALLLGAVGAALGLRIGRSASRELAAAARRMEHVSSTRGPSGTTKMAAEMAAVPGPRSIPEVRQMALALDRVTETVAAMAADQKRALTARAEAARLRSFVLAGVSHDLRGPLNSVLGFAGLLLAGVDGAVSAGQRESLEALARGGRDLLRLVDDLLDAARLDAGRMTLTLDRVVVGELLAGARGAAQERTADVLRGEATLPSDGDLGAEVRVDRERMVRALGALLAWALLRPGSAGTASMRVREPREQDPAESDGADRLVVTIHGDGTTPSREALAQLLDPFDVAPSGARTRAGLGLAAGVARRVIELHGGVVRAEPGADGGVAVLVHLPRCPPRVSTRVPDGAPRDGRTTRATRP